MHFLLIYTLVDDYIEKRPQFRAEHLSLAKSAAERGELLLGGALADPPDMAILLFTGDSLFPGGPGKTQNPEDFTTLMDDLEERVFAVYADHALVLPGHGDNTTLGAERPQLPQWRARGW